MPGGRTTHCGNAYDDTASQVFSVSRPESVAPPGPELSGGQVDPAKGPASSHFVFSVSYTGPGSSVRAKVEALIDGQSHTMVPRTGNPKTGLLFEFGADLGPGPHGYRFQFDDTQGHVIQTPETEGPEVK
jgi:hypothetical protein